MSNGKMKPSRKMVKRKTVTVKKGSKPMVKKITRKKMKSKMKRK